LFSRVAVDSLRETGLKCELGRQASVLKVRYLN
jgi:hypothetical protein